MQRIQNTGGCNATNNGACEPAEVKLHGNIQWLKRDCVSDNEINSTISGDAPPPSCAYPTCTKGAPADG
jgi:hypothetical protein